jgi:hypothetical protein
VPSPSKEIAAYAEPLNVIISACSDVPLSDIEDAMPDWSTVTSGYVGFHGIPVRCISPEAADVTGGGFVRQDQAWRLEGCAGGNYLSLSGLEDHVRIWNQPVAGSRYGAWFITASNETMCVSADGKLEPFRTRNGEYRLRNVFSLFHCVDGGLGSFGASGYGNGAATFVRYIAAAREGWHFTDTIITRPAGGPDAGEDNVPFSDNVYVVTVTS